MYKDNETNLYVVEFPWINDSPTTPERLGSNYRLVLAKFKDTMKTLDKVPDKLEQ